MGYSYDYRNRLCCDSCGMSGGVRKRTCPYKVLTASHRSENRLSMNYCYPSALCAVCYKSERATLHEGCAAGAATSQARYDLKQTRLDAGEHLLTSGSGSWLDHVPDGFVEATFHANRYQDKQVRIVPKDLYEYIRTDELSLETIERDGLITNA